MDASFVGAVFLEQSLAAVGRTVILEIGTRPLHGAWTSHNLVAGFLKGVSQGWAIQDTFLSKNDFSR